MKLVLFLAFCTVCVLGKPQGDDYRYAQILKYENDVRPDGGYFFSYETSDGQTRSETAEIVDRGLETEHIRVYGEYSWIGPDNVKYVVKFVADEGGFQPEGDHLPNAANTRGTPNLGIPSAALGSLVGGGLG